MNLIKNGGFESGNTERWHDESTGLLEASNLLSKYGIYNGKYTCNGTIHGLVINDDYISVGGYNILQLSGWIKGSVNDIAYIVVYYYDSDYSLIEYVDQEVIPVTGVWLEVLSQVNVPANAVYVRVGWHLDPALANAIFCMDGYSMQVANMSSALRGDIRLIDGTPITANGDSTSNKQDLREFESYYADVIVHNTSGTNETLDVDVYEDSPAGFGVLVGSFAQITGVGNERILLTKVTGRRFYLKWTVGGTNPTFIIVVDVIGKR